MTAPTNQDSFQIFWDHGFNHKETNRKLNCLQTWIASREDAEKKIEKLTDQMELFARMRWGYDKIELLNILSDVKGRASAVLKEIRGEG